MAVVMGTACVALAADPGADEAARKEEGKKAFSLGVTLLTDPDGARYDEALPHFRKAFELTKSWKVLGNLGLCLMKLERVSEAIDVYDRYLKEGGNEIEPEEKAQVQRDLTTLKAQVVKVHIEVPEANATLTDERIKPNGTKVVNTYALAGTSFDVGVYPGRHGFFVSTDPAGMRWEVELGPGSSATHKFEKKAAPPPSASVSVPLPPPPPPSASASAGPPEEKPTFSTPVLISGGVTAALAVGTVITGVVYLGKRSDYQTINQEKGRTSAERSSARDSASTMGLVSTLFGAGTLIGAGVTTYLFLTQDSSSSSQTGKTRVTPVMSPSFAGFVVGGSL